MGRTVIDDWDWSTLEDGLAKAIKLADEIEANPACRNSEPEAMADALEEIHELIQELQSELGDMERAMDGEEDHERLVDEAVDEALKEFKEDACNLDAATLARLEELLRDNPERDPAACKRLSDMIWKEVGLA